MEANKVGLGLKSKHFWVVLFIRFEENLHNIKTKYITIKIPLILLISMRLADTLLALLNYSFLFKQQCHLLMGPGTGVSDAHAAKSAHSISII